MVNSYNRPPHPYRVCAGKLSQLAAAQGAVEVRDSVELAARCVRSLIDHGGLMSMGWFAEALWQRDQSHAHFECNDATQRLAQALLRDAS
jgi:hypothetical protein